MPNRWWGRWDSWEGGHHLAHLEALFTPQEVAKIVQRGVPVSNSRVDIGAWAPPYTGADLLRLVRDIERNGPKFWTYSIWLISRCLSALRKLRKPACMLRENSYRSSHRHSCYLLLACGGRGNACCLPFEAVMIGV
jgi:hypothetical protein